MTKLILLFLLLLICYEYSSGQITAWQVKGQVVGEGQQPLGSATVALMDNDNKPVV